MAFFKLKSSNNKFNVRKKVNEHHEKSKINSFKTPFCITSCINIHAQLIAQLMGLIILKFKALLLLITPCQDTLPISWQSFIFLHLEAIPKPTTVSVRDTEERKLGWSVWIGLNEESYTFPNYLEDTSGQLIPNYRSEKNESTLGDRTTRAAFSWHHFRVNKYHQNSVILMTLFRYYIRYYYIMLGQVGIVLHLVLISWPLPFHSTTTLPSYSDRCILFYLDTLESRRTKACVSFISNLLRGNVDAPDLRRL